MTEQDRAVLRTLVDACNASYMPYSIARGRFDTLVGWIEQYGANCGKVGELRETNDAEK